MQEHRQNKLAHYIANFVEENFAYLGRRGIAEQIWTFLGLHI